MLTPDQCETFERAGWLRLANAIAVEDVDRMRARVWDVLGEELGADPAQPESWRDGKADRLKRLAKDGELDAFGSPVVRSVLDGLFDDGEGWSTAYEWGRVLFTFPTPGPWSLPRVQWHLDLRPTATPRRLDGVTLFALLDDLEPEGGGTLLVEGSHRIVIDCVESGRPLEASRSADLRKHLAKVEPYFGALFAGEGTDRRARFVDASERVRGVDCRVVELTGRAGDVFVVHPHVFHTTAPNVCARPRLMLVEFARRGGPLPGR